MKNFGDMAKRFIRDEMEALQSGPQSFAPAPQQQGFNPQWQQQQTYNPQWQPPPQPQIFGGRPQPYFPATPGNQQPPVQDPGSRPVSSRGFVPPNPYFAATPGYQQQAPYLQQEYQPQTPYPQQGFQQQQAPYPQQGYQQQQAPYPQQGYQQPQEPYAQPGYPPPQAQAPQPGYLPPQVSYPAQGYQQPQPPFPPQGYQTGSPAPMSQSGYPVQPYAAQPPQVGYPAPGYVPPPAHQGGGILGGMGGGLATGLAGGVVGGLAGEMVGNALFGHDRDQAVQPREEIVNNYIEAPQQQAQPLDPGFDPNAGGGSSGDDGSNYSDSGTGDGSW